MPLSLLMMMAPTCGFASDTQATLDAHSSVSVLVRTARIDWSAFKIVLS